MNIKEWLAANGDYNTGVQLYVSSGKSKPNLVRIFTKKETPYNRAKLKGELNKLVKICTSANNLTNTQTNVTTTPTTVVSSTPSQTKQSITPKQVAVSNQQPYTSLQLHQVPTELREVYLEQKQLFAKVCFLHDDLKKLRPEQETEALELCLMIETLWDEIDLLWYQLDYYKEYRIVLKTKKEDFNSLTPTQLLQKRNNTRANLTKHKKAYEKLASKPPQTELLSVLKEYNNKLRHKEKTILNNENLLLQLNKLVNGK